MQITGNDHMVADRSTAWAAFHDPGVLTRTIPGLQSLTEDGTDRYKVAVSAGVAAIKGTYTGVVEFIEQHPEESFVLRASGAGGPGTIEADIAVTITDAADGGIDLAWEADASVGGAVGGVGQRMLTGVARKMAAGFFAAIDQDIATGGQTASQPAAAAAAAAPDAAVAGASEGQPRTWTAPQPAAAAGSADQKKDFFLGSVFGAIVMAIGVLIGSRVRR